jgi:hypothetical protein
MKVVGASDNYGTEHGAILNNVFGAHLRITALRSSGGPGVELLEYLTPRTRPVDPRRLDRGRSLVLADQHDEPLRGRVGEGRRR